MKYYKAEKLPLHKIGGIRAEQIDLYVSQGYTIYVTEIATRNEKVDALSGHMWRVFRMPKTPQELAATKTEVLLEGPEQILHPTDYEGRLSLVQPIIMDPDEPLIGGDPSSWAPGITKTIVTGGAVLAFVVVAVLYFIFRGRG